MASIGISDVVTASVYSEKTRLKKLMMTMKIIIIIISVMKKSQKIDCFSLALEIFRYETKARIVMVDFKFDYTGKSSYRAS